MKTIQRDHLFSRRINFVEQKRKHYVISREKCKDVTVSRTAELDKAFRNENWNAFETAEMEQIASINNN